MIIHIDVREAALISHIQTMNEQQTVKAQIELKQLPIGDIIIFETNEVERIIIERKTVADLLSSIKDGRYDEQSFRLNGLPNHNHNIIYLIEGDISKRQLQDRQLAYSAIFSLSHFKGFSVFRSMNVEESAAIICNMAAKMQRELGKKTPFYKNADDRSSTCKNVSLQENKMSEENPVEEENVEEEKESAFKTNTNYASVIKKVKKENITPDNIGEIMLQQIPGVSSSMAALIMAEHKTVGQLINALKADPTVLNNLTMDTTTGKKKKLSKPGIANLLRYLVSCDSI